MHLYFKRQIHSTAGTRCVGVTCEKCGGEYFYELSRVGIGDAIAPHMGVGVDEIDVSIAPTAAAAKSSQRAQRNLNKQLASEAELVPCPKCHWINDELVRGYRRGRYSRLLFWGPGAAIIGIAASLICAFFLSIGPGPGQNEMFFFLYVGPAICVAWGIAMILVRRWLQSQIQPNYNFPQAPQLPPGTPGALIMNSSGELQPVERDDEQATENKTWHDFVIGRHRFPQNCCVCLKKITTALPPYMLFVSKAIQLEIPRCAECSH